MERKIVKRIGNLEMDEKGIVYKTSRGGFKAPPLPEQYKIPYPKKGPDEKPICGLYPSEVSFALEADNIDQMNALKEMRYQAGLIAGYRNLQSIYRRQERKKIARKSIAFIMKFVRRYREYRR